MASFFQELKSAREAKHLSLSDIADATLININYLEQIELGNTLILPQTYIRAFVREYALVVGLDPVAVMKSYDEQTGTAPPSPSRPVPAEVPTNNSSFVSTQSLRWIFAAVAIVGTAIILWASLGKETPPPVQEIPFQSVIKENEHRLAPAPLPEKHVEPAQVALPHPDSLTLHATITDTLWMRIVVDQNPPREYIFKPHSSVTWRGRERFVLTLGNGGAVQFTLNQKEIGALGRKGSVTRDIILTRESLKPAENPQR